MRVPAWLANVEMELALARRTRDGWLMPSEDFEIALLTWLCGPVHRWLDTTRVEGDRAARRLWARICRCYLSVANFLFLRDVDGWRTHPIVRTCVRLAGLARAR